MADEQKQSAPGAENGAANGELSKGQQRKLAKKAAKMAKRAAAKGEAPPADAPSTGGSSAPLPSVVQKPTLVYTEPVQPLAAMIVSRMTNTDIGCIAKRVAPGEAVPQPQLLLPNGAGLCGDVTIARFLARSAQQEGLFGGADALKQAYVDQWCEIVLSTPQGEAFNLALDAALATRTFLAGYYVTIADVVIWSALTAGAGGGRGSTGPDLSAFANIQRWFQHLSSMEAFENPGMALRKLSVPPKKGGKGGEGGKKGGKNVDQGGCPPLEGAVEGQVMTRFPPEPSGYMHLGHVKAVMLNNYYARTYKGKLLVRFDDTNPSKEKEEFEENILKDLEKLEVVPDVVSHTSDFFDEIQNYARKLIGEGKAYMDATPMEVMRDERMKMQDSKYRDTSPEENLELFEKLLKGEKDAQPYCLRAKINMSDPNGTLRDPVLYRYNDTPHHRTGTRYKAYPTYDLACPIVDSLEGVSHALRTTEYNDRDAQYHWLQAAMGLREVRIHAFARLNFVYTLLSKRKLQQFVDEGLVDGWFDPRFPTVQGLIRRGVQVPVLRDFILSQGASRRIVNMEWDKFWAKNKQALEPTARRFMAVFAGSCVPFDVEGADVPETDDGTHAKTVPLIPKDPTKGSRAMRIARRVFLEGGDAEAVTEGEEITLMRWMNFVVTQIEKDEAGRVIRLIGRSNPEGSPKTTKLKVNWIADVPEKSTVQLVEYDFLISKPKLEDDDDWHDFLVDPSEVVTEALGDPLLNHINEGEFVQLERRGFFRCDRPFGGPEVPARFIMVPDGKSKAMSVLGGAATHR